MGKPASRPRVAAIGLILVIGVLAYANSFDGVFLLDDEERIAENPSIQRLWPPSVWLAGTSRPLVQLTLAFNYAWSGLDVRSYHAVNLAIHLLAALTLYGLLRRTLQTPRLCARYGSQASGMALAVALLWTVHPLQTESVTYLIQRAEALAGLCTLLTLYSVHRAADARRWRATAILACSLGMLSKPVMATAPLLAALYDRVFLAGSWRALWRLRRSLYLGLASTWVLLGIALWQGRTDYEASAGFLQRHIDPLTYLLTQPGVILHYLRLAVWPAGLCLDYFDWPLVSMWTDAWPSLLAVGGLLAASLWALGHFPAAGCTGVAFFLWLALTSSVIPLRDVVVEHRMYLPLAALCILGVAAAEAALRRLIASVTARRLLAAGLVAAATLGLSLLTIRRNAAYASPLAMWQGVVEKRPHNPRGHTNLGVTLAMAGRREEAVRHYRLALQLDPSLAETHNNLALALAEQGHLEEAIAGYREALRLQPNYAQAHYNLGSALAQLGRFEEAIARYREALRLRPRYVEAYNNLGIALARVGRMADARAAYEAVVRINPDYVEAYNNLGALLASRGLFEEAKRHLEDALARQPAYAKAHNNLGNVLVRLGRPEEAARHYQRALQLNPDYLEARRNLEALGNR